MPPEQYRQPPPGIEAQLGGFSEHRAEVARSRRRQRVADGEGVPATVSHADWGVAAGKRWRVTATLQPDGSYLSDQTALVGTAGSVRERMGCPPTGAVLLGFDFPIGLPWTYAARADLPRFPEALALFGTGLWDRFFDVADGIEEVSLHRPFYPRGAGKQGDHSREKHRDKLGFDSDAMLRRCERAHDGGPPANPLFWTLGGAQVGKGALAGWREMLLPLLTDPASDVAIWPFDGELRELIGRRGVVVVETYPKVFYEFLDVRFGNRDADGKSGKTRQHDRCVQADALLSHADGLGVTLTPALRDEIVHGFGSGKDGEDRFDALVGLLGMIREISDPVLDETPYHDAAITEVEGWILGRPDPGSIPKPILCPACKTGRLIWILWGMPAMDEELRAAVDTNEVIIGGCMPGVETRQCDHCGHTV